MMRELVRSKFARAFYGGESGQSLIETALVLSLLTVILLGAVELGQVAYTAIEVSSAAKAGVQYGAKSGNAAQDATGIQNAALLDVPNLSGLIANSSYACVCSDGSSSTCKLTDCTNAHMEESVTVNTQYTLSPMVRLPGLPSSFTLTGQAVQKCAE